MVQRTACSSSSSSETSASLNGVPSSERDGRTFGVEVVATDAVVAPAAGAVVDGEAAASLTRGGSGRFSLFRWFKRSREPTVEKRRRTTGARPDDGVVRRRSVYSSVESVDTFYSTTTVRSFAFHTGTLGGCDVLSLDILKQAAEVGPFAAGASKVSVGNKENRDTSTTIARTLPANVHSRRGRDITARYSLHPSTTFGSCGNFPEKTLSGRLDERARVVSLDGSVRRRVHVKGKRRAPNPPGLVVKVVEVNVRETPKNSNRRKRRAPRPPEKTTEHRYAEERTNIANGGMDVERKDADEEQSISNDTLVLQRGMLLSKKEVRGSSSLAKDVGGDVGASNVPVLQERAQSPVASSLGTAMPRPWYKRSVFEHNREHSGSSKRGVILRNPTTSAAIREESVTSSTSYSVDGSLSRLNFFHRGEKQGDDRMREAKRRSGLSILTNISELDKEAAAIVQEEQARARASMLLKTSTLADAFEKRNNINEEIVQDMVTSAIESSSPRRGTRALISKFNAISNITKVTVNTNFFTRRDQPVFKFEDRDAARHSGRFEHVGDWRDRRHPTQQDLRHSVRVDKDISRYFLPQQRTSRGNVGSTRADLEAESIETGSGKEKSDQLMKDASDRISLLQSQLAPNRIGEPQDTQKNMAFPVMEEKSRSRREFAEGRKDKDSPRLNNETSRRFLFSCARNSAESTENAPDSSREKAEGRRGGVQKEFSDIFDEIDRQLRSREFKLIERRPTIDESGGVRAKVAEDEAAASSKVAKVLDILVEAEKDSRTRPTAMQSEGSIQNKEAPRLIDSDPKTKSGKTKSTALNTVEDPITVDLKEMLKEMKHSLPKRPKPKKTMSNDADLLEKVEKRSPVPTNKTSYIASVTTRTEAAASSNDYETDKQKVSSSAQTSGNIRRLNQPSTSAERPSTSGWRRENVLYRTSGKGSALVKNTFQLIRPRDFAEIEATKTTKGVYRENTYANVIEPSLYANAHVPPSSPKQRSDQTRPKDISQNSHVKITPGSTANITPNEDEFAEEGNVTHFATIFRW